MTILQEIQAWAPTLPKWQQDAIVRLFLKGELSTEDYDDLYALLQSEHGIADPKGRVANQLAPAQVAAVQRPETRVQLVAVKNLRNVNALAERQILPVNPDGLTIIYGDNGSGKSGYSRVLKKACRARDQNEHILPDAKLAPGKVGKAAASFDLLIDGSPETVAWIDGEISPETLSSIAIFDARCARAYVDEQDDFSYVPYGLDILEGLAKACNRLKVRLDTDHGPPVNTTAYSVLASTPTAVGKLLSGLSAQTKPVAVETLTTLSPAEIDRHASLNKLLKEGNPKEKAQQLRLRSGRITKLLERCASSVTKVSNVESAKMRAALDDYKTAKAAADLAAKQFKEAPGQLAGTGGEAWQELLAAARKFVVESHPDKEFPHLGAESACPLCQQPLGDAAERLVAFEAFIQRDLEKTVREKRAAAEAAYNLWKNADLSIALDAELESELGALDPNLPQACKSLESAITARRDAVKSACGGKCQWEDIGAEPSTSALGLKAWSDKLIAEATILEKASDEKARAALDLEFKELDTRMQLQPMKAAVLDTIAKLVFQSKLKNCQASVKTNAISIKSTDLNEKVVSTDLANSLNAEFKQLSVGELHVSLESKTEKGKTLHKLVLQLPGKQRPTLILSEGEQRAIAIASFLAEVNVGGGKGGIIFDDPVSSLDHRRRELVATRLVEEAKKRQVIVLTHDVYFLCILQQEAERIGVSASALSLHKTPDGFGVADDELPFEGATTSKRVGMLRQMQVNCAKLNKNGDEKEYRKQARDLYFHLRLAWERAVEEVLFCEVVTRFREGVATQKLKGVVVEDTDYVAVDGGMTKCSKYAHDKAAVGMIAIPPPEELTADIEALETWRTTIMKRNQETGKKRSA